LVSSAISRRPGRSAMAMARPPVVFGPPDSSGAGLAGQRKSDRGQADPFSVCPGRPLGCRAYGETRVCHGCELFRRPDVRWVCTGFSAGHRFLKHHVPMSYAAPLRTAQGSGRPSAGLGRPQTNGYRPRAKGLPLMADNCMAARAVQWNLQSPLRRVQPRISPAIDGRQ